MLGILLGHRVLLPLAPSAWRRGRARWLAEALAVSLAAFVATAPVAAYFFGQVAPVSILANLPAIPLSSLALVGVAMAALTAPLAPPFARLVADGAGLALDALDRVAAFAADVPLGHLVVTRPQVWLWLATAAVLVLALRLARRLRPPVRSAVAIGLACAVPLGSPGLARVQPGALEIHFLDVGQGDAVALRTPRGRWLLVDAGPKGREYDAGERRVLPFLRTHGATRLDALVLTHPDADHIGGAAAVLRGVRVDRVVDPGLAAGKELYLDVLRAAAARGTAWHEARPGSVLRVDGVALEFLWPEQSLLDAAVEPNQISAVVRLRFGRFAMLLTGDAPVSVEHELVAREAGALRAQVLKAGHHGSATSTSAELLDAVAPELVVVSAGRRNRYGHPAPEVLERVFARGIEVARTDREGTVSLRVPPGDAGAWERIEP